MHMDQVCLNKSNTWTNSEVGGGKKASSIFTLAYIAVVLSFFDTLRYRFAEIYYRRGESTHKGRVLPTRVETVVLFVPDVWSCLPTRVEWDGLVAGCKKQLQRKLPDETDEAPDAQDEDDCVAEDDKKEPTHFSELDPKTIKVNDLKHELEARNLSTKGLKSQLIARLTKALKTECEKESGDQLIEQDEDAADGDKQDTADDADDEKKKDKEEDRKQVDDKERIIGEKRNLPECPVIVVQPSRTAKSGKFDCTVMSLSVLLDYRQEDNKEHSFEVSLFAELFNEMMMRDFGFRIYRSLVEAPEMKDDDKEKDKKKYDKKDEKKDRKDEKDDYRRKDDAENDSDKDYDDSDDDDYDIDDKRDKERRKRRKKKPQMYTHDPYLLLSYIYYDQTHCGYLLEKDLEEIFYTLGLQLSRAQVRKVIQKVCKRELFRYRKLTDRPVGGEKPSKSDTSKINLADLAIGNKKYIPMFKPTLPSKSVGDNDAEESGKNQSTLVSYEGALIDVRKLMDQLERSEKARLETDEKFKKLESELDGMNETALAKEKHSQKISTDLEDQKQKLRVTEDELKKSQQQSDKLSKALNSVKDQLQTAMTTVETAFKSKSSRSSNTRNNDGPSSRREGDSDSSSTSNNHGKGKLDLISSKDSTKSTNGLSNSEQSACSPIAIGSKVSTGDDLKDNSKNVKTEPMEME